MGPVRVASIGLGGWAQNLARHAADAGLDIVACYARSPEARETFAADFGAAPAPSWQHVLDDPDVEAVLIATPHSTHAQLAIDAANAGKHVFVEKPMTMTTAEGKHVIAACADAGVVLQVGHKRRYEPALRRIKTMMDAGDLGVVHLVEANQSNPGALEDPPGWSGAASENPAGGMGRLGVHMVDAVLYLLGRPTRISAFSKRLIGVPETDADEVTLATLEFASGPLGYLASSTVIPRIADIRVHGTNATAIAELEVPRFRVQSIDAREAVEVELDSVDVVHEELVEFVQCVREGATPEIDGAAGLDVVSVWEGMAESAASGTVVDLDEVYRRN